MLNPPTSGLDRSQTTQSAEAVSFFPTAAILVEIPENEESRLRQVADRIRAQDPRISDTFSGGTKSGVLPGRCLFVGDTREIALARPISETTFEYRLSLLARADDLVVFSQGPHAAFERYRNGYLGRGPVVPITPRPDEENPLQPVADRCRLDRKIFSLLTEIARHEGGLTIAPHIGLGAAWRLAAALADTAGVDVCVASPPPILTARVNDKLWFNRLAAQVIGRDSIAPTYSVHSLAALVKRVRELEPQAARIVVKIPDSAGGLGNVCFAAHEFDRATLLAVKNQIGTVLHGLGWQDTFPLLIGLWETPAICSPSVQLWIPSPSCGPPVLEGIFEQRLEGRRGVFVGSMPSQLPNHWQLQLAHEAMALAIVLQSLGYYGRCSLDSIIVGQDLDQAHLHWIECNGRWGGVSIPLTLVKQLVSPFKAQFVVVQRTEETHVPRSFSEVVQTLDPLLYKYGSRKDGIVLLSPCELETGAGVQMLGIASTLDAAAHLSDQGVHKLFARGS